MLQNRCWYDYLKLDWDLLRKKKINCAWIFISTCYCCQWLKCVCLILSNPQLLLFLKAFSETEQTKLAMLSGILLANGTLPATILTSLFTDNIVKEGNFLNDLLSHSSFNWRCILLCHILYVGSLLLFNKAEAHTDSKGQCTFWDLTRAVKSRMTTKSKTNTNTRMKLTSVPYVGYCWFVGCFFFVYKCCWCSVSVKWNREHIKPKWTLQKGRVQALSHAK